MLQKKIVKCNPENEPFDNNIEGKDYSTTVMHYVVDDLLEEIADGIEMINNGQYFQCKKLLEQIRKDMQISISDNNKLSTENSLQ
ncbi:hypothetical protein [Agarilytica rhodophyticola]|uniref:hypothetical protein n=1 Tax=Agarilytica rhodophyticola TaxID=1737490 RepID=UPI000B342587|nr:hypothetical protein [Agarilytica rhodophyticola]